MSTCLQKKKEKKISDNEVRTFVYNTTCTKKNLIYGGWNRLVGTEA
jgi:hypothetical protein